MRPSNRRQYARAFSGLAALAKRFTPSTTSNYRAALTALAKGGKSKPRTRAIPSRLRRRRNPMARKIIRQVGGAPSFSKFYSTKKPSPRVKSMKRVGAANYDIVNSSFAVKVDEGFQSGAQVGYQTLADLKRVVSHISSGPQPTQFVIESVTSEMLLTNSSLATLYVDIYDIVRKRDAGADADSADPLTAWKTGATDQTPSALADAYKMINSLPTDSRLLKNYFKVVQRSHIALQQGATHKHSVKLKSNHLVDSSLLNNASGDLAGLTMYTLIVAYGQPASIIPEGAPSIVTTAAGIIDVVQCQRFKYSFVQDSTNTMFQQDNLSTLTGEQIVSFGAGQFVTNDYK